ncbi:M23 family metallopeptidase [Brevibacillus parabrevis]|uniref:M23 family metallopeptidase n=1 Tax=Brevibacillus parabrevis TaxID=54914 RepID=UPI001C21A8B0|nr:M23 family metallopeptidase [Brevibacillus parabrevis]MBU8715377.1 M23 family metallopeptidase [Brevibacillus parabrevis]
MPAFNIDDMLREYRVTSPYGPRKDPITGASETFHTGVDLVKAHRAPIRAFVDGTITHAKIGVSGTGYGGFGIVVAVRDKNGYTHMYAHLDDVSVHVGDMVQRGDVVGHQGSTGRSTGSHLHYEVRRRGYGTHTDPIAYLREYYPVSKPDAPTPELAEKAEEDVMKAIEAWKLELADKAIDSLAVKKLLQNADEWKARLRKEPQKVLEDLPWLLFVMVDRATNGGGK